MIEHETKYVNFKADNNDIDVDIKVKGEVVVRIKPNVENIIGLIFNRSHHPIDQTHSPESLPAHTVPE